MKRGRSYSVNRPSIDGKFASKYPGLARIPFILDSRPAYHREGNAYLIDRALGLWSPELQASLRARRLPTPLTILSYAQWLANFLEWCEARSVDLLTCSYSADISGRYQKEMLEGRWSRSGHCLAPATINPRVQQACDFLNWLIQTGRRVSAFEVPYTIGRIKIGSATSSTGHLHKEIRVREGKVRRQPRALQMPPDESVQQWLQSVRSRSCLAIGIMCESVLLTAMRREEIVSLRVDTLPHNPANWLIANPSAPENQKMVRINITFGTKGPMYGLDKGEKIGPSRDILIPLSLARRWDEYRRGPRNSAFAQWMTGVRGQVARRARADDAVNLFLRDSDGARFQGFELYDAWTGSELPIKGWSPHQGRHWWACSVLWRELKKYENIQHLSNETAAALIESSALSIIRLQIQPQLGHASHETTMVYLRWVMDMLSCPVMLDEV